MARRLSLPLRVRVTLLYVVMGLVMSLLFALTVTFITEDYESVLVEEILRSQANDYGLRLRDEPDAILPRSSRLSGYVRHKDGSGEVPDALAALPPGVYESEHADETGVHMAVFDTQVGRLYFTIDLKNIEPLEMRMEEILLAVILLGTLVSAWLGWMLSGSVVRPVRSLADAVDALSTKPVHTDLAATLPQDALGRLGSAIDDYQARLVADQEAERAFFADASHELRTPISVVRGATELLIEDGAGMPALQRRLHRLDRGVRQLSGLLDALLGLARNRVGTTEVVSLRDWVSACAVTADAVRDGTVGLEVEGDNRPCRLPPHEAALVLNGLVRQIAPPGRTGTLRIAIDGNAITLQVITSDQADPDRDAGDKTPDSSDSGFGTTLIGRLATQIGWQVDEEPWAHRARLDLPADAFAVDEDGATA